MIKADRLTQTGRDGPVASGDLAQKTLGPGAPGRFEIKKRAVLVEQNAGYLGSFVRHRPAPLCLFARSIGTAGAEAQGETRHCLNI